MQPALIAIWLSVLLGAILGIGQRFSPRVTEPIRTFAVVAAALVVCLSLLPHALECEGVAGLLGAAAGYLAIPGLERLGKAAFQRMDPHALRLELGYAGLLFHRFGDGVTMSLEGHGHAVLWALGAHEVPIVALVTLGFAPRGFGVALLRAAGLGLSSSLGYFLVSALPAERWGALHRWADAAAAGVLLHIVAHEGLRLQPRAPSEAAPVEPRSLPQRALDAGAGLMACAFIAALSLDHDSGALGLLQHLLLLALQLSPWLCLGLLLRAALYRRQLRPALQLGARVLDPVAVACSLALLGVRVTVVHVALVLLLAALWLGLRAQRASGTLARPLLERAPLPSFGATLERELAPLAGWVLLGFLAAAYVQAYVPPLLAESGPLPRVAWTAAISAMAIGSAPAAMPLAAALVSLGLPAPAALAGLSLGSCAPLLLGGARGDGTAPRPALTSALLLVAAAAVLGAAAGSALVPALAVQPIGSAASAVSWLSLAALLAVVGRHIWQTGVRVWLLASLCPPLWTGHGHGHEHPSPGHG